MVRDPQNTLVRGRSVVQSYPAAPLYPNKTGAKSHTAKSAIRQNLAERSANVRKNPGSIWTVPFVGCSP